MKIRFWGVRGSFVAAGAEFTRYGGNTPCVEVTEGDNRLILDLGSGAIPLGRALLADGAQGRRISILLSHTHIDHIMGFPFFAPVFHPKASLTIYGPRGAGKRIESVLDDSLNPDYSPLFSIANLSAKLEFHELSEKSFRVEGFDITCAPMPHARTVSWAFRIRSGAGTVVYMTDVGYPGGSPGKSAVALAQDADIVIHDATFSPEEYPQREKWGHASWEHALALAERAGAKKLVLFHHSTDRTDDEVDRFVVLAREAGPKGLQVVGAMEGDGGEIEVRSE